MNLSSAVSSYISVKRAQGHGFKAEGIILKSFGKAVGDIPLARVQPEEVLAFLNGDGPVTEWWAKKYGVLSRFYRFALARGWTSRSPLPRGIPKPTAPAFVPYIYSHAELKRLLDAAPFVCSGRRAVDAHILKALLLLLYGAGLRLGEALALSLRDVDLQHACLDIRQTKFFKHRLVPMGADLTRAMREYLLERNGIYAVTPDSPFFCRRNGSALTQAIARSAFQQLRVVARIERKGGCRRQPRLHDLRHTAAVHRVIAWYRNGVDLAERLPKLPTYLGHGDLSATQRYLTMTPELLHEACLRFERYAREGNHE